jgi:hypothetical protein
VNYHTDIRLTSMVTVVAYSGVISAWHDLRIDRIQCTNRVQWTVHARYNPTSSMRSNLKSRAQPHVPTSRTQVVWPEAWTRTTVPETRRVRWQLGYWRNVWHSEWPDPSELVDLTWNRDERVVVSKYLRTSAFRLDYVMGGSSFCRFCGKVNGNRELCDGVYFWPSGLAHYRSRRPNNTRRIVRPQRRRRATAVAGRT